MYDLYRGFICIAKGLRGWTEKKSCGVRICFIQLQLSKDEVGEKFHGYRCCCLANICLRKVTGSGGLSLEKVTSAREIPNMLAE